MSYLKNNECCKISHSCQEEHVALYCRQASLDILLFDCETKVRFSPTSYCMTSVQKVSSTKLV